MMTDQTLPLSSDHSWRAGLWIDTPNGFEIIIHTLIWFETIENPESGKGGNFSSQNGGKNKKNCIFHQNFGFTSKKHEKENQQSSMNFLTIYHHKILKRVKSLRFNPSRRDLLYISWNPAHFTFPLPQNFPIQIT